MKITLKLKRCYREYKELWVLFIGFILTSVIGSYIVTSFQDKNLSNQNILNQKEVERNASTQLFSDISSLMDKRLYRMRQVYWSLQKKR